MMGNFGSGNCFEFIYNPSIIFILQREYFFWLVSFQSLIVYECYFDLSQLGRNQWEQYGFGYQCMRIGENNNNMQLYFGGYSEFLESEGQIGGYTGGVSVSSYANNMNFLQNQYLQKQHDIIYSQFTETIGKRIIYSPYPANFKNCNPYCPLCLRFVQNDKIFSTCFINEERNYLIHADCMEKDKSYAMRSLGQIPENTFKLEDCTNLSANKFDFGLDSRQFFLQLSLTHPINDKSFLRFSKKVSLVRNYFSINFSQKEENSYFPNIVALPLTDFLLTINVVELGKQGSHAKFTKYLSLRNIKDKQFVKVQSQDVWFDAEVIREEAEKEKIFQKMNYKYKYGGKKDLQLLRILNFSVRIPQELEESEEEYIIENNSIQKLFFKEQSVDSTIKSSQPSPVKTKSRVCSSDSNNSEEVSPQTQKVNLEKLISSNTLIEFVKNNTQSRFFQNYLINEAGQAEIQAIIQHVKPHLVDLIKHDYGNYMVQKLFSVCHPYQRLHILETILPEFCELIKNKQGTHTIQAFISYFSLHEEFTIVSFQLRQEYYELCRNNNSTHFIQKVIKVFPLQYMLPFFSYTTQNLLAFALDKNAMCVIKHMMRRFRQLQGKEGQNYQALQLTRRQLITHVTFSVDKLIMDNYGNYVIQFCYELFDLEKCVGITQRILSRFATYAIGKFSSNVLLKCIGSYWVDKKIYWSLKSLSNTQIVEIFRNKDGNKILLEIMEKLEGTEFWDRLYSTLIKVEPTRFYHDRWGVCLGSRSGQVGTRFTGFPQPKKKYRNNRKM